MINNANISLDLIQATHVKRHRKTKVICTLGPACWSVEGLGKLIDAGMNIARFNFSHGDHKAHGACLERLREAVAQRPGVHVAVMLDTKGPEIRTGMLDASCNGKLKLTKGAKIEVGTDYGRPSTPDYLACSYESLPVSVSPGSRILVADGSLSLEVVECRPTSIIATILNNAVIGDRKNMNLPGAVVDLPTLTEKDIDDLTNWGLVNDIDFVAASFVRKASDIEFIRSVLGPRGSHIKIIAKIENQEGLDNYDDILTKTDAIMVARGDLGMEIPIEKVFLAQKMMISRANIAGKPVVTATQMLESMITNPRPTRAECADVANAVLDGTDCVMLSGETANGEYSVEAVQCMTRTCMEAESMIDTDQLYEHIRRAVLNNVGKIAAEESVASSAVKTARDIKASLIICLTQTGATARLLAKYRPGMPVLILTATPAIARQCQGYLKNCHCEVTKEYTSAHAVVSSAIDRSVDEGWCEKGDSIVVIHGSADLTFISGSTRLMQIYTA